MNGLWQLHHIAVMLAGFLCGVGVVLLVTGDVVGGHLYIGLSAVMLWVGWDARKRSRRGEW